MKDGLPEHVLKCRGFLRGLICMPASGLACAEARCAFSAHPQKGCLWPGPLVPKHAVAYCIRYLVDVGLSTVAPRYIGELAPTEDARHQVPSSQTAQPTLPLRIFSRSWRSNLGFLLQYQKSVKASPSILKTPQPSSRLAEC